MQPYQQQKASQWSEPELMGQITKTQGSRHQRRGGMKWLTASLRAKTLAVAIAIGTLPVLGIGTFAYFTTAQGVEKQNFASLQVSSQDLLDKLVLFMDERYKDIQVYASLAIFTDAKVAKATPVERKNELLDEYTKTSGVYDSIAVVDLKGEPLYKSDADTLDNASELDWFQAVLKTDRPFISEPRASKTTGVFSYFSLLQSRRRALAKQSPSSVFASLWLLSKKCFESQVNGSKTFLRSILLTKFSLVAQKKLLVKRSSKYFPS
jgi:hypothetical protein